MSDPNGHIFISYARANEGDRLAAHLQQQLEERGHICWRDVFDLNRVQDFTVEIERAIEAAAHVVVCVTADVRDSKWVHREIGYAEACDIPITPLILEKDVLPPIALINHTWVEQCEIGWDDTLNDLEVCFEQGQSEPRPALPTELAADPFRDYLNTLYKAIVNDLDRMVIKQIDLSTRTTSGAVAQEKQAITLNQSFFGRGLNVREIEAADPVHDGTFDNFSAAFDHYDGRVLLLGEPGAGKTTTLMAYARDAVARRLDDPTAPLPVPAILSSWPSHDPTELAEWLAAVNGDIPGMVKVIRDGQALLLLDGLDELGSSREEEIEEENEDGEKDKVKRPYDPRQQFLEHIPVDNRILVTCRVRDYEQIGQKAALDGAVTLQPLTIEQMKEYLEDYPNLWAAIQGDDTLRELCETPLLLSIFAYGFGEAKEEERQALQSLADSPAELRDRIFGMYVERRYEHEHLRVQAMGESLPFTLEEIYQALGTAVRRRLIDIINDWVNIKDDTMLVLANFSSTQSAMMTQLCQQLHYLTQFENKKTNEIGWRFTHLLLRAHFGVPVLIKNLGHENWRVRGSTANALGKIGDSRAVASLIDRLDDESSDVRSRAAHALGQIGNVRAAPPLTDHLSDVNGYVSGRAAEALGQIGDSHAVPSLMACLGDTDWYICSNTATVLGQIGDARAVSPLIDLLDNKNKIVCNNATFALESINTPQALAAVEAWEADPYNFDPAAFLAEWEREHGPSDEG